VGAHIRLATSAMGRAWYCGLTRPEQGAFMDLLEQRKSKDWPKIRDGLLQAREDFQRLGFVLSLGDWKPEISAVGVPLPLGGGDLDFALNCGGPSFSLPRNRLIEDLGPRLAECVAKVRQAMMRADAPVLSSVA
jgi:DNA-binding IclR family transcriptional regulator